MATLDERGTEEVFDVNVGSAEDVKFDETMGALEEILMSDDFAALQAKFCADNSAIFSDDVDENRHEYHETFEAYSRTMETYIERALETSVKNFSMKSFTRTLVERKDETPGDVLDLLLGLSDFVEFKQMMLAYKAGQPLDFLVGDHK